MNMNESIDERDTEKPENSRAGSEASRKRQLATLLSRVEEEKSGEMEMASGSAQTGKKSTRKQSARSDSRLDPSEDVDVVETASGDKQAPPETMPVTRRSSRARK